MVSKEILFTNWVEDVKAVIEQLTEGPIVLVGCSMGGKCYKSVAGTEKKIVWLFLFRLAGFSCWRAIERKTTWYALVCTCNQLRVPLLQKTSGQTTTEFATKNP